jgi:uncharacterized tellurite resistance protein B-like protein
MYAACPFCRQIVSLRGEHLGTSVQCPNCGGTFAVNASPNHHQSLQADTESEGIHPALFWTLVVIGHGAAAIILAIPLGVCASAFLVVFAAIIEVSVWQWPLLFRLLSEFINRSEEGILDAELDEPPAGRAQQPEPASSTRQSDPPRRRDIWSSSMNRPAATKSTSPSTRSSVIEIGFEDEKQPAAHSPPPRTSAEYIPPRRAPSSFIPRFGQHEGRSTLNDQGADLRPGQGDFFGPGTVLNLGRFSVREPLVYATASISTFHGWQTSVDASLIDGSLPIAPSGTEPAEQLPYWPSYSEATPQQRAKYLDWLAAGRCDPRVELGYVFIYFYGLERRVLVDEADHIPIIEELLRLRTFYCSSRSFDRYSGSLLWLAVALAGRSNALGTQLLDATISSTSRWDESLLAQCLAYFQERGLPLPPDVAIRVAKADPRTPSSVIVRRQEHRFQELFLKKYADRFGAGMALKASKRSRPLHYHPASATLHASTHSERFSQALLNIPDVLGISSQFKPLVEMWEECIEELRAYDKASRASGGKLTAEAYEALPEELRTGEHPEFDRWFRLWEEKANAEGLPVVPVGALAALKGLAQRATLLKGQCLKLLSTADCLGIGIEPDTRLSGKNYRWDDQVVLFFRETDGKEEPATYQAASLLLELGMYIATADDRIDTDELALIATHLEEQFSLSPDEFKRLECRRQLLCLNPPKDARVSAAIRKKLDRQQRQLIGEYLVGIAAADQVISPREMSSLRRLYDQLELDPSDLDALLAPLAATRPVEAPKQAVVAKPSEFRLDLHAVSRIMNETKEVARILQDAMDVDEEDDFLETFSSTPSVVVESQTAATVAAVVETTAIAEKTLPGDFHPSVEGLERRYHPFVEALLAKPEWPLSEARELAKSHHVMLNGAIEAINEWSQEQFGDWLIEEGDSLVIHSTILRN